MADDSNYWERLRRNDRTSPSQSKSPGSFLDKLLYAAKNPGAYAETALRAAAAHAVTPPEISDDLKNRVQFALMAMASPINASIYGPLVVRQYPKPAPPPPSPPGSAGSANAAERGINDRLMEKAPGMVGDIASKLFGISDQIVGEYNNTPEQILKRLMESTPGYSYNGPSPDAMAQKEFAPQFEILKQAAAANQQRYSTNKTEMSGLWNALVKDVGNQRTEDQQNYAQSNQQLGAIFDQSAQSQTANMNDATKQMGDVLGLLGQNAAAPSLLENKQELLQKSLAQNAAAKNSAQELNTNLGANAFAYDTSRIGNTAQAGLGAQQDLLQQFVGLQNENDMRRLDVQGQQGAAENKYAMMIQELLQGGMQDRNSAINDSFQNILGAQDKQAQLELQQGRLNLDQSRFAADVGQQGQADPRNMNPYQILLQNAAEAYQDPAQGRQVADQILRTAMENPNADMRTFFELLGPQFLAEPNNQNLAYDYYYRVLKDKAR